LRNYNAFFFLILLSGLIPSFAVGSNLFTNSSFEVGDYFWYFGETGPNAGGAPRDFILEPLSQKGTHRRAFKLDHSDSEAISIWSHWIRLKPNQQYTYSVYYYKTCSGTLWLTPKVANADRVNGKDPSFTSGEWKMDKQNTWSRMSVTFTTADDAYNWYTFVFAENYTGTACTVWVDDIQLNEGPVPDNYGPKAKVEIGITTEKRGNIFYTSDPFQVTLNLWNGSGSKQTKTVNYEVYDIYHNKVESGSFSKSIGETSYDSQNVTFPITSTGYYYLIAWIAGDDVWTDSQLALVPVPQNTSTIDYDAIWGTHSHSSANHIEATQRLGLKWLRAMSTAQIGRWALVEPSEGNYSFAAGDIFVANANAYKLGIYWNIGCDGGLGYTCPSWAYLNDSSNHYLNFNNTNPATITRDSTYDFRRYFSNGNKIAVFVTNNDLTPNRKGNHFSSGVYTIDTVTSDTITLDRRDHLEVDDTSSTHHSYYILNLKKWENFVHNLVSHYRGNIKYIEVWNEPGANTVLQRCPECMAKILEIAHDQAASVDNDIKMMGWAETSAKVGKNIISNMDTSKIDWFSYHAYPGYEGLAESFDTNILNSHKWNGVNSETGPFSCPTLMMNPMERWRRHTGKMTDPEYYPISAISYLLINIFGTVNCGTFDTTYCTKKYMYYDSRQKVTPDGKGYYSQWTMINPNHSVKPHAVAYAVVAKLFDKASSVGEKLSMPANVTSYLWVDKDGIPWNIVWTSDDSKKALTTKLNYSIYDVMGNLTVASTSIIPVGRIPTYVKSLQSKDNTRKDFEKALIASRQDTLPPKIMLLDRPIRALKAGENVVFRWFGVDKDSIPVESGRNRVQYSWKLNEVDSAWTGWSNNWYASYDNVRGGDYVFSIRARDETGNISEVTIKNGEVLR
jgi:hypothetical protein